MQRVPANRLEDVMAKTTEPEQREMYGCTICQQKYEDFIQAIYCCEDVDKHGDNFFTIPVIGAVHPEGS